MRSCTDIWGHAQIYEVLHRYMRSCTDTWGHAQIYEVMHRYMRSCTDKPIVTWCADKPIVTSTSEDQYGWTNEVRTLTCVASGLPPPSITWLRGSHYITSHDTARITTTKSLATETSSSVLEVTIKADREQLVYGNYTCTAKNNHGSSTGSMLLHRAGLVEYTAQNVSISEFMFQCMSTLTTVNHPRLPQCGNVGVVLYG